MYIVFIEDKHYLFLFSFAIKIMNMSINNIKYCIMNTFLNFFIIIYYNNLSTIITIYYNY